jgi:hypothetical protein
MSIRKRAGSVLFTAAAAAAVVGMSLGTALASTSLTVKVTHGGSYTAAAKTTVLTDPTKEGPISVTCSTKGKTPSSTASGTLKNGARHGKNEVKLGTVSKLKFNDCSGELGATSTTVHGTPVLNADSKTNSKGDTDAIITGVDVSVSIPAAGCAFTVTGAAPGYYSNKTHSLYMTPSKLPVKALEKAQLTISGVAKGACAGVVQNGQHPTYLATYKISRSITIKSS